MKILNGNLNVGILGSNGQLGQILNKYIPEGVNVFNYTRKDIDLTELDRNNLNELLIRDKINIFINCAAFTDVKLAEKCNIEASLVNAESLIEIIDVCNTNKIKLIHISTDYVFSGSDLDYSYKSYKYPCQEYGITKSRGEDYIIDSSDDYLIIRTSYLYSEIGKNLVKTLINLIKTRDSIDLVCDQIISPTNCHDLAKFIWKVFNVENSHIIQYSNSGYTTPYELMESILKFYKLHIDDDLKVKLNKTFINDYDDGVIRPKNSRFNLSETEDRFNVKIEKWHDSLENFIKSLDHNITI